MRVLITNDDGVQAEGLLHLKRALESFAEVTVVAPDRPRSACGHSITLHKPLRMDSVVLADGSPAWAASGTPADCVTLALLDLMRDRPPDLLFSGINHGPNLGWDLTYSGTVSAAMEGTIHGIPSVAISVAWRFRRVVAEEEQVIPPLEFGHAASFAQNLAKLLINRPLPPYSLLNVNVPYSEPIGVRVTRQGIRRYPAKLDRRLDPMGRAYYWIGGDDPVDEHAPGNDVTAIAEGHISVTPIHLNLTDEALQEALEQAIPWNGPPGSCTPLAAP